MSIGGQPPVTARKVPVWRTAVDSYRFVFANLDRFAVLACVPVLILVGTSLAFFFFPLLIRVFFVAWLISWVAWAALAVRWHRFVLLEDRGGVFKGILTRRNLRFLTYSLILAFVPAAIPLGMFISMSFSLEVLTPFFQAVVDIAGPSKDVDLRDILRIGVWLAVTGLIPIILLVLMLRFAFVLPAAAVGRPMSLGEAWREMGGNSWRFIGTNVLLAIPYLIVAFVVDDGWPFFTDTDPTLHEMRMSAEGLVVVNPTPVKSFGYNPLDTFYFTSFSFVVAITEVLFLAAAVTALSKFYRHIVDGERGETGAAATGP